jgi:CO dehydrogenase maturation factor
LSEVIAICGKGGAGKTTLAALFSRLVLEHREIRALVIDADPTGGLSLALALPTKITVNDLRKEVVASARNKAGNTRGLAAAVDYRLFEALTEHHNIAFLAVGRPEEEGCYCQVNTFLRSSIEYLSEKFDLVIIDAEAGVEQVNRRVISSVDRLLLISDQSQKGLRVAETVYQISTASGQLRQSGLILNRVRSEEELNHARAATALPFLGWLPEDEIVYRFDSTGESFLNLPDCPSLQAARLFLGIKQ